MPGRFDLETTTLQELLDDPESRAILDEVVPELPNHPMLGMVKGMPVNQLLALAGGQIPADTVATLRARIEAL